MTSRSNIGPAEDHGRLTDGNIWIDGEKFRAQLMSTSFSPETSFWPSWIRVNKSETSTKPFATYDIIVKNPENIIIFKCIKTLMLEIKYIQI
ncbi:unnamed protein product [Gordionus sp. m RMFG-2023]